MYSKIADKKMGLASYVFEVNAVLILKGKDTRLKRAYINLWYSRIGGKDVYVRAYAQIAKRGYDFKYRNMDKYMRG